MLVMVSSCYLGVLQILSQRGTQCQSGSLHQETRDSHAVEPGTSARHCMGFSVYCKNQKVSRSYDLRIRAVRAGCRSKGAGSCFRRGQTDGNRRPDEVPAVSIVATQGRKFFDSISDSLLTVRIAMPLSMQHSSVSPSNACTHQHAQLSVLARTSADEADVRECAHNLPPTRSATVPHAHYTALAGRIRCIWLR
jgi:hypothetical protein